MTFPTIAQLGATPANSEFDPSTWRALTAALGRIDLNSIKNFITYPTPDTNGRINLAGPADAQYVGQFTSAQQQFDAAQKQRRDMAQAIYDRLRAVTGAIQPPATAPAPELPANADFQA